MNNKLEKLCNHCIYYNNGMCKAFEASKKKCEEINCIYKKILLENERSVK